MLSTGYLSKIVSERRTIISLDFLLSLLLIIISFSLPAWKSIRKTIDTLQLRIQALTDKKLKLKNLLQAAVPHAGTRYPTNNDTRSKIESQLKSLDEVISDASKQMEKYLIMKDMVISSSS